MLKLQSHVLHFLRDFVHKQPRSRTGFAFVVHFVQNARVQASKLHRSFPQAACSEGGREGEKEKPYILSVWCWCGLIMLPSLRALQKACQVVNYCRVKNIACWESKLSFFKKPVSISEGGKNTLRKNVSNAW